MWVRLALSTEWAETAESLAGGVGPVMLGVVIEGTAGNGPCGEDEGWLAAAGSEIIVELLLRMGTNYLLVAKEIPEREE